MKMSKLTGFIRFYGRRIIRGWGRVRNVFQGMAAQHRKRSRLQRSIFAVTAVAVLTGVGLTAGWNIANRMDTSPSWDPPAEVDVDQQQASSFPTLPEPPAERIAALPPEDTSDQTQPVALRSVEPEQVAKAPAQMPPVRVEEEMNRDFHPKVDALPPDEEAQLTASTADTVADMIWPVSGSIERPFGWYRHPVFGDWRHDSSVSLAPQDDLEVRASLAGRVRDVVREGGLWRVSIEHDGGLTSEYEGLLAVNVQSYALIDTGAPIGTAPDPESGRTVGFTLLSDGSAVDPQTLIGGPGLPVLAP